MSNEDICFLTGTEALSLFKRKELSPVELVDALIDRAESVEPKINAFASTYYELAKEKARLAEHRFTKRHSEVRALEGLALVVKSDSESALKGTTSSDGSVWMKDKIDDETSPSIDRLISAGAILLARTTMPEMGWTWTCHSKAHGVTRNPWNPIYTSGGSSGGSAASIAAGTSIIATGTDCLGSLRHPSAMCGVVGYKPPHGRNPLHASVAFDMFSHIGPITRSVFDCALMQNCMSGPHALDHGSWHSKQRLVTPFGNVENLKIAFCMDLGGFPVTEEVSRSTLTTLDILRAEGAEVTEVDLDWAKDLMESASRFTDRLNGGMFRKALDEHPDEVSQYISYYSKISEEINDGELGEILEQAGFIWASSLGPLFEHFDALICPTLAFHHVPAELMPWECDIAVGEQVYRDDDAVMTGLFNLYSRCPVMVVPSGYTKEGLPTSIQIAGRPMDDSTVFAIAAVLESALLWYQNEGTRPKKMA